jgi:hypothetical protein
VHADSNLHVRAGAAYLPFVRLVRQAAADGYSQSINQYKSKKT